MPNGETSNSYFRNTMARAVLGTLRLPAMEVTTDVDGATRRRFQVEYDSDLQTICEERRRFDRLAEQLSGDLERYISDDSTSAAGHFDAMCSQAENVLTAEVLAKDCPSETLRILRHALGTLIVALLDYVESVLRDLYGAGILGHVEEIGDELFRCVFIELKGFASPADAVSEMLSAVHGIDGSVTDAGTSDSEVEEVIHRREFFVEERYTIQNLPRELGRHQAVREVIAVLPKMLELEVTILRGREFRDKVASGATDRSVRDVCVIVLHKYAIRHVTIGKARPIRQRRVASKGRRTIGTALPAMRVPSLSAIAVVVALSAIAVCTVQEGGTVGGKTEGLEEQPNTQSEQVEPHNSDAAQETATSTDAPGNGPESTHTENDGSSGSSVRGLPSRKVCAPPVRTDLTYPRRAPSGRLLTQNNRMNQNVEVASAMPSENVDASQFYPQLGQDKWYDAKERWLWTHVFDAIPQEHRTETSMNKLAKLFYRWYSHQPETRDYSSYADSAKEFEREMLRYGAYETVVNIRQKCRR